MALFESRRNNMAWSSSPRGRQCQERPGAGHENEAERLWQPSFRHRRDVTRQGKRTRKNVLKPIRKAAGISWLAGIERNEPPEYAIYGVAALHHSTPPSDFPDGRFISARTRRPLFFSLAADCVSPQCVRRTRKQPLRQPPRLSEVEVLPGNHIDDRDELSGLSSQRWQIELSSWGAHLRTAPEVHAKWTRHPGKHDNTLRNPR